MARPAVRVLCLSVLLSVVVVSAGAELYMDCSAPEPYRPISVQSPFNSDTIVRSHAIAMHGEPKYPVDFRHFDYVNPKAPKGGRMTLAQRGTFDSFNTFIDKGNSASTGSVETLTIRSEDEAFTQYGLLAESMEWPIDRSWIVFHLRKEARWHDGVPVTADDVIWTFYTLIEKGQPFYRFYYASVISVDKLGEHSVRFKFSESTNRELPLIIGQLPVLPKHYWETRDFTKPTLEPPLGSGPYRVKHFDAGRILTLERVNDYWGSELPVRTGLNNFDEQHFKFYRDDTAIRLSLKAGDTDLRVENQAKAWALDYELPASKKGWLKKEHFATSRTQGMQAFVMNLRRPAFQDVRVRQALDIAFDFEWSNANLFFGQYTRSTSYWSNSELAATGEPTAEELSIISHYRSCLPPEVFGPPYTPPRSEGNGWPRDNIVKASALLEAAGYEIRDFKLVNKRTKEPLQFEILYSSPTFERVVLPYIRNLDRLGIQVSARIVDQSQYVTRLRSFDYDMIWSGWGQSESPGNEQRDFFSSNAADNPSSRNYAGIKNPIVDQLIELVIQAPTRESLVARTRALDRVLLVNRYVVPNWHLPAVRMVYWDKFGKPSILTKDGPLISAWWYDESRASALANAITRDESLRQVGQGGTDRSSDSMAKMDESATDRKPPSSILLVLLALLIAAIVWFAHVGLTDKTTDVRG